MPVVVRYQTKPDRAEESQALIEKVFEDFRSASRKGSPTRCSASRRVSSSIS